LKDKEELRHCRHEGQYSWWEYDGYGIELCRVCDKCVKVKLAQYRPEVLGTRYEADEPIEASE